MQPVAEVASKRWELYRVLAEPVRLRLLALTAHEELAIGELAELLGESQPNVSRHVAPLRDRGLCAVRKQGTRALVRLADRADADPVVADALRAGRTLCETDGSLARVADVVRARDAAAREFFARPRDAHAATAVAPELPAYLTALAALLPRRGLAVDVGTGDGALLDVLAPVFDRVVAVDREDAQLARAGKRLDARGYHNVELVHGELDDADVRARVRAMGGADAVFASRVLHHAPRPAAAMKALATMLRPGGALVVIDYESHDDESMREMQADLWLGFDAKDLHDWAVRAGLSGVALAPIPALRRGNGPDGHLGWQLCVARRPD